MSKVISLRDSFGKITAYKPKLLSSLGKIKIKTKIKANKQNKPPTTKNQGYLLRFGWAIGITIVI